MCFFFFQKRVCFFSCWPWVSLELPETVCSCSEITSFPTWIPPLSAGGGFQVGVCFIVPQRNPFLCWKTSPGQCFTEQKILWGTNYHLSGSHGLGWYCVPGCTLTSFTAFLPSLLNILKWWLCQLFLLLIFWQMIAPWCQLSPASKK